MKKESEMRFCFFLGYKDTKGGYTSLLLTLIKELYHQNKEVILFNFRGGLIENELKKENITIKIIDIKYFNWKQIDKEILPDDVFIISKFLEVYKYLFEINPKFIYYDINDYISQISDYKYGIRLPFLAKKLIRKLLKHNGLVFMDDTGIYNLDRKFSIKVRDPIFLPLPVMVPKENLYLKKRKTNSDIIHLTYVGRSVDWKMMPLRKILEDFDNVNISKKIHFSIIVDNLIECRKFINPDNYAHNKSLSINFLENMAPSAINDFLLQNSDLHFAMGTSALDGAKLGIPTILLDYGKKSFPKNYGYKPLFQTTKYSLGRNLDKISATLGLSMKDIVNWYDEDKQIQFFSEKSYEYVLQYHSADKIVSKLLTVCRQTDFRIMHARYLIPFYYKTHAFAKTIAASLNSKTE